MFQFLIVEQPLAELLEQLPLLPEVKLALLKREGQLGLFLRLTEALEQADWPLTDRIMRSLPQLGDLTPLFLEAVSWAESVLRAR